MKLINQKVKDYFPNFKLLMTENLNFKIALLVRSLHLLIEKGTIFFALLLYLKAEGFSMSKIALINTIYFIPQFFFASFLGSLSDALGNRRVFLYLAFFCSGLLYFLYPFTELLLAIILIRFLQGILESSVRPLSQTLITENIKNEKKGERVSLFKTMVFSGGVAGPILMGFLITYSKFSYIFYLSGLTIVFCSYLSWKYLDLKSKKEKIIDEIKEVIRTFSFKEIKKHFFNSFAHFSSDKETPRAFSFLK